MCKHILISEIGHKIAIQFNKYLLVFISDVAVTSSVLLTPDNTPTKESQITSTNFELPCEDLTEKNVLEINDLNHSNKALLSRSRSDSRLDSPAPRQSKLTRSEDPQCTIHSKPISAKSTGHGRGRAGRSKKDSAKFKAVTTKSEAGIAKETKQNNKTDVKANQKSARSQSVPGTRYFMFF